MIIEKAASRALPKPWGSGDRMPWSSAEPGDIIGEIWFERPGQPDANTSLLRKLLFTRQPLSIQVHPDDGMAHLLCLSRGKSEAWYHPVRRTRAKLARGLSEATTPDALRAAVADGSVETLVHWQSVQAHDTIAIPAGIIHALGAGLVVAELQQRSDTTYRLFDFGRERALQVDLAVAAADLSLTAATAPARRARPRADHPWRGRDDPAGRHARCNPGRRLPDRRHVLTSHQGSRMTHLRRLAFIGNSLPRRCGIATFTTDLQQAVAASDPDLETCIVAMTEPGQRYDYPAAVGFEIDDATIENYVKPPNSSTPDAIRPSRCSTSSASSAARRAAISWRCWRAW